MIFPSMELIWLEPNKVQTSTFATKLCLKILVNSPLGLNAVAILIQSSFSDISVDSREIAIDMERPVVGIRPVQAPPPILWSHLIVWAGPGLVFALNC
ncbi:Uncharacterized protein TCM_000871 [Theobroma cacao]|uniref:Uncharacterized protein n=1 Tax=Theobroma cacao TaxID=3641 RepID=A0A061DHW4_THECC|nr:Uncharacterized protein TCM_000871 [Theobroma cacao]